MRSPSSRGPAPRREAEVRRTANKGTATNMSAAELAALPFEVDLEPTPPPVPEPMSPEEASREWPPIVRQLYEAVQRDPARTWMGAADWAGLVVACETLSRELHPQVVGTTPDGQILRDLVPPKAGMLAVFFKYLNQIGITEDARMRLHKEITFHHVEPAEAAEGTVDLAEYRRSLAQ